MIRRLLAVARALAGLVLAGLLLASSVVPGRSQGPSGPIPADAWQLYRERFIDSTGRVVDDANGRVSHSEGQGYGMLLAFLAGDRVSFERLWSFTRTELLIRDDGLAAWRWDPSLTPRVTDINAASDGDILIAYALARAGAAWNEPRYVTAARRLASAIGDSVVQRSGDRLILLPGPVGFGAGDRKDGPVVNLSYWVFEAFPVLAELAPETDWAALSLSGLKLIAAARLGPAKLPPDWLAVPAHGALTPAQGFAPVFGYNSLRIVLYLLRAGIKDAGSLEIFSRSWSVENGGEPAIVDVPSGRVLARLTEPGYRMIGAVLSCALNGVPIPDDLRRFEPTHYYPSTLYLLGLSLVVEVYPQCL